MELFVSWSGDLSHRIALLLQEWIPQIIQSVTPFVSSEDIDKGARWSDEIAGRLDATHEGLVVVTAENQAQPWLNFEAGALAKSKTASRVRTVLVDLTNSDLQGPLTAFQSTRLSSRGDTYALFQSLNAGCAQPLTEANLERIFNRVWDEMSAAFEQAAAQTPTSTAKPRRGTTDLLDEVLERVRSIERSVEGQSAVEGQSKLGELRRQNLRLRRNVEGMYQVGRKVEHADYGIGVITAVQMDGREQALITVDFGSESKRFIAWMAPLKVVFPPAPEPSWANDGRVAPKPQVGQVYEEPPF